MFSVAKMVSHIFSECPQLTCPASLVSAMKKMTSPDVRRRPVVEALLRLDCFANEQLQIMSTISELQVKQTPERLATYSTFIERADIISRAVCSFKLLPVLAQSLQEVVTAFPVQEARKLCREVQYSMYRVGCGGPTLVRLHRDKETFGHSNLCFHFLWTCTGRPMT